MAIPQREDRCRMSFVDIPRWLCISFDCSARSETTPPTRFIKSQLQIYHVQNTTKHHLHVGKINRRNPPPLLRSTIQFSTIAAISGLDLRLGRRSPSHQRFILPIGAAFSGPSMTSPMQLQGGISRLATRRRRCRSGGEAPEFDEGLHRFQNSAVWAGVVRIH
ncbi:hypothetical protein P152DRAFT_28801 [Eremomyces bilateralis CBS 781.70]|uniref:Uncharacterized protein n=1 Tax=Eremomyces bilateralis CBS 781.70 TaxID=1392243 RepID=A0A6G1G2I5_9PEZI|nr:uncharacterized protein P152DRAFT_28801 [Eremomyces bilateralis CBS 781.70]KAF1812228.1 hypothetical protein P152DRAFT_28801 [Eremomyces bilateralis CBS 781.70]